MEGRHKPAFPRELHPIELRTTGFGRKSRNTQGIRYACQRNPLCPDVGKKLRLQRNLCEMGMGLKRSRREGGAKKVGRKKLEGFSWIRTGSRFLLKGASMRKKGSGVQINALLLRKTAVGSHQNTPKHTDVYEGKGD